MGQRKLSRKGKSSRKQERNDKSRKRSSKIKSKSKRSRSSSKSRKQRWCGKAPVVQVGNVCVIRRPEGMYKMSKAQEKKWNKVQDDPDEVSEFFLKMRKEGCFSK